MLLERIQSYLKTLERRPRPVPLALRVRPDQVHSTFFASFNESAGDDPNSPRARQLRADWQKPRRQLFADLYLWQVEELAGTLDAKVLPELLSFGFRYALGLDLDASSQNLHMLLEAAQEAAERSKPPRAQWQKLRRSIEFEGSFPARYCRELLLVIPKDEELVLSGSGQLILRLNGLDCLRWLLTLERRLSTGAEDPYRLDRHTAKRLIDTPSDSVEVQPGQYPGTSLLESRAGLATLRRLCAMGALELEDEEERQMGIVWEHWCYRVYDEFIPLLKELESPGETPTQIAADSLIRSDRGALLGVPLPPDPLPRMIAHEISNALLPVELSLNLLYEDLQKAQHGDLLDAFRPAVDKGIRRALTFSRDLARLSELAEPPEIVFKLQAALNDALNDLDIPQRVTLKRELPKGEDALVSGPKESFVRAIVNLLQNAYRALERSGGTISVSMARADGQAMVYMDDSGPGVPEDKREMIFQPGVSLSGGSGQGLALVKEVIETRMGGQIACSESPLGGARFTLHLPLTREERHV